MTNLIFNAPWGAWRRFVNWPKKSHKAPRRADHIPKGISEHLAHDIGLSAHDLALLRHEWPSAQYSGRL